VGGVAFLRGMPTLGVWSSFSFFQYCCSIVGFFGLTGNLENIIRFLLTDLILDRNLQKMPKPCINKPKYFGVFWFDRVL
jgi:hypothetical protein